MPSPADAAVFQGALKDLATLVLRDLTQLWKLIQARSFDAVQTRDVLIAAGPDLVNPYAGHAAQLTTIWYDQLAPGSAYRAVAAPLPPRAALDASARWAVSPLFGPATVNTTDSPLERLAGSMQRRVLDASRETVLINADREGGTTWARYASATACAFCRMLATRGAVYSSQAAAEQVVGRGKEMSLADRRARAAGRTRVDGHMAAGGKRTRGTRQLGDGYHDHCKCIAVPVRSGDSYQPPPYVEQWEAQYIKATRETEKVGRYGAIDPKAVLAHMRADIAAP